MYMNTNNEYTNEAFSMCTQIKYFKIIKPNSN